MATKHKGLGLLNKLLIGVLTPVLLGFIVIGSMIFYSWGVGPIEVTSIRDMGSGSFRQIKSFMLLESKISMGKLVEQRIEEKAIALAAETSLFLKAHPDIKVEDLARTPMFASQVKAHADTNIDVAIYNVQGVNLLHVNPAFTGINLRELFAGNPEMLRLVEGEFKNATSGYYDWKDNSGKTFPKFICFAPIQDTDLVAVVDAAVDELSKPAGTIEKRVDQIEKKYLQQYQDKLKLFFITIVAIMVIILAVVILISRTLIHPIRYLSEVANKISMGDLDTPIEIEAKGEVGMLAESIERMQTSVRQAIQRLRKTR